MKKSWIILIVVLLLVLIIYSSIKGTYNKMVLFNENVTKQWSNVENVYQRRLDLIPNLVSTVKGYAEYEQETLTQVIEARSRATGVTVDPNNITAENLQQFQAMQGALSSALSRLLVVVERYPELKANQNFLELQAQLEGTENRIAVERRKFNETAQTYNTFIKQFPKNIYASIFNFEEKAYFTAEKEAAEVPTVEF